MRNTKYIFVSSSLKEIQFPYDDKALTVFFTHGIDMESIATELENGNYPEHLTLKLGGYNLCFEGLKPIIHALKNLKYSLQLTLDLFQNNIEDDGIKLITDMLQIENRYISNLALRLTNNKFTNESAKFIANAVKSEFCPKILNIDISCNAINSEGAKYIAEALKSEHCPTHLTMILRHTQIDTEGEQALIHALFELATQGRPLPTLLGLSDHFESLQKITRCISTLNHPSSHEEVDIKMVLHIIALCFDTSPAILSLTIVNYIVGFLSACIIQKSEERSKDDVITLIHFFEKKINSSKAISSNPHFKELCQKEFYKLLLQSHFSFGNKESEYLYKKIRSDESSIEEKEAAEKQLSSLFKDIFPIQAALLYYMAQGKEDDYAYIRKLQSLLLLLHNKKNTEENRATLPTELHEDPEYSRAITEINKHVTALFKKPHIELAEEDAPPRKIASHG